MDKREKKCENGLNKTQNKILISMFQKLSDDFQSASTGNLTHMLGLLSRSSAQPGMWLGQSIDQTVYSRHRSQLDLARTPTFNGSESNAAIFLACLSKLEVPKHQRTFTLA